MAGSAVRGEPAVIARLSRLDRFLPVWIAAAMAAGIGLGRLIPDLNTALNKVAIHGTSLPIAVGLLLMMYPVLAKVRYREIGQIAADRRMMAASLLLNWVIGPAVMFALAWALLPDQPDYRTGVILVGLARCIAMVLIWTDLADGDREMAAVLVALNAIFQVLAYAALGVFYLDVLPRWLGLSTESLSVSMGTIAGTVAIFLGIPLAAGYLTRTFGERARGQAWYEQRFLPRVGPVALYGLLFTVVILFALQGRKITAEPWDVARIALPLLGYFALMWFGGFATGRRLGLSYRRTAALAFSAASNDFELAIAVAIGVFGVTSGQALAGVVGPLIEVPVLLALVYVALWARRRYYADEDQETPLGPRQGDRFDGVARSVPVTLQILHTPDCPHTALLSARLRAALSGRDVRIEDRVISDKREAAAAGMTGSPTLLVDGRDPFAVAGQPPSVSCRLYADETGALGGAPTVGQLRIVLGVGDRSGRPAGQTR